MSWVAQVADSRDMWNYLIVIGAAIGAAVVWVVGMKLGWPWLIGAAMGGFIGYWARDLVLEDQKEQQAQPPVPSEDSR